LSNPARSAPAVTCLEGNLGMAETEVNDRWPAEPTADQEAVQPAGGVTETADADLQPQVLAQLPDLETVETASEGPPASSDGRIISQGLSTKLLVGGSVLLVMAAIIPFLFGKKESPKPGDVKLPEWHQGAPAADADRAPAWTGQAPQAPAAEQNLPGPPPELSIPAVPGGDAAAQRPPVWNVQQRSPQLNAPAQAVRNRWQTAPPAAVRTPVRDLPSASQMAPAGTHSAARPQIADGPMPDAHSPADGRRWRYEAKRPRADDYPDYRQSEARSNQAMTLGQRTIPAAGQPVPDYQPAYRDEPRANSAQGLQTDSRARYPAGSQGGYRPGGQGEYRPPPVEPGVARFEGLIENPPLRTSHDRSRPSVR